ncbi:MULTISPECIES: oligosaccharide flippase family protein [unclassified Paracoccus (in: a-proteobacteria)]|uniref:oligosaccharide flippase family protein n=1 Tax=unclassified Paracoccus (in: a-proteobacteria) TaxID=2688777 RepID=UPI001E4EEC34|nr:MULTISPECIES: oligosaccharide flippase family protein [unclassified Paracoccus (in: a-proteobacteria)]UXU75133.1 oligosaccharide flippase family protein [Paracoccus sp. SMMA_5]UXU81035.1 oligosaccharide flippase family protein [Paracoccus sp. SMMA_5_TC]
MNEMPATQSSSDRDESQAARKSLASRALGSGAWSMANFGLGQIMRLVSNLVLTRLLSPDDFGLMTLVTSFLIALTMFSDMGFGPAIMQSKRGDDPDFVDTIWTLKIIRGGLLWLSAAAMALPLAWFYDAPEFAVVFPVAALSLLVGGFLPTRIDSAARHLQIGRLTVIELANQLIGILLTIAAAWILQSVWALVWGNVLGSLVQLLMFRLFLPGHRNRLRIEPEARAEVMKFGKWIFFSTICGFMLFQGDRIILGLVLTLHQLGIYNIGLFLATVPMMLGSSIASRLFIPMYRNHPPAEGADHRRVLARTRAGLTALLLSVAVLLAWIGPPLVELLYDPRYATAGGVLVAIACIQMLQVIPISYDYSALAAGDSRGFFVMQSLRALIYMSMVSAGAFLYGLPGLLVGQALSLVLCYPVTVWLARRHHAWDPRHDLVAVIIATVAIAMALTSHRDAITKALFS